MTDTVEQLLRDHAREWIAGQPTPPSLPDAVRACQRPAAGKPIRTYLAIAATVIVVAAVAAISVIAGVGRHRGMTGERLTSGPTPTSSPSPTDRGKPNSPPARVTARARAFARLDQDPAATGQAVRTTYRIARRIVFDNETSTPPDDTPVWVVELRGRFTCGNCHGAPSAGKPPTYTAILFTVDANTFATYDTLITTHPRNLAKAGHVVRLPL